MGKLTIPASGKDYVKWTKPGQTIKGILQKLELSRGSSEMKMLHMVDADGGTFMVSAPLLLAEAVEEHFKQLVDQEIEITFVSKDPDKGKKSGLMRFSIDVDDGA